MNEVYPIHSRTSLPAFATYRSMIGKFRMPEHSFRCPDAMRESTVENMNGELTGILSKNDVSRFREENSSPDALVAECMTINIITIAPEMTLDYAEKTMIANGLGSLPVVRDNRVIGMITVTDVKNLHEKIGSQ